jgi:hypothetical protein
MEQYLQIPAAEARLAAATLQRIRKAAARAGKWICPSCNERTISANAAACFACSQLPKEN